MNYFDFHIDLSFLISEIKLGDLYRTKDFIESSSSALHGEINVETIKFIIR